jgi:hypothetical protein
LFISSTVSEILLTSHNARLPVLWNSGRVTRSWSFGVPDPDRTERDWW